MNEHCQMNRGQIALVLLARIFEMDNDELTDTFRAATGHWLNDHTSSPETGDVWGCDRSFSSYFNLDQHRILDYLRSQLPPA